MSFDEQPDGDIHGECAAEIHRLEQELREKSEELARCDSDILRWRTSYEHSCTQNVHLCEKIDDCRPYLKEGETVADAMARLERSGSFYRRRCEALQEWQSSMRDPERVIVCDILANGFTLDQPFAGDRYAWLVPAAPTTKETA
jgi:hypothetical protein